jgi:hypothetical protein
MKRLREGSLYISEWIVFDTTVLGTFLLTVRGHKGGLAGLVKIWRTKF